MYPRGSLSNYTPVKKPTQSAWITYNAARSYSERVQLELVLSGACGAQDAQVQRAPTRGRGIGEHAQCERRTRHREGGHGQARIVVRVVDGGRTSAAAATREMSLTHVRVRSQVCQIYAP